MSVFASEVRVIRLSTSCNLRPPQMFRSALLLLLLLLQDTAWSVKLMELRVRSHAAEGGSTLLGCQYDLEGDVLYSVKWYKDNAEFYRYVPTNDPPIRPFPKPGVNVNLNRSSNTIVVVKDLSQKSGGGNSNVMTRFSKSVVVLEGLTQESEGEYACEVSGEAPSFTTVRSAKHITIYLVPDSGPHVTGLRDKYSVDEQVVVNCTSSASRPVAELSWLVNEQPVSEYDLRGPWLRQSDERPDAGEITLQLRFKVAPEHFVNGSMKLKCQATIDPLYQRETNSTHYIRTPKHDDDPSVKHNAGLDQSKGSSSKQFKAMLFLFTVVPIILI